ncbi:MAG TPA: hypothetical protein VGG19_15565 [Tepidisphaeraceae bacterium]|jgi:hypothetical protein
MKITAPKSQWLCRSLLLPLLLIIGCTDRPLPNGVYVYDKKPIISYLQTYGIHVDGIYNYWQDGQGTALYIPFGDHKVAVISSSRNTPEVVDIKGVSYPFAFWIDADAKLRLLPSFAKYPNDSNTATAVDWQSGFFLQTQSSINGDIFYVGHMSDTKGWLIVGHDTRHFIPNQVCARGDTIYLQDNSDASPGTPLFNPHKNCWVYRRNSQNQYVKVDEFRINGQIFNVDPFHPRFFCAGYGSMPFCTPDFLFDVAKHEEIRPLMTEKIVLFFASDWLGPRLSESR